MFKKYKLLYMLYNVFNKKYLKHNLTLYKKYGLNKMYFSPISSQDFKGINEKLNVYDIHDSKELLKNNSAYLKLETTTQKAILEWSDRGYAIIKGFFSPSEVDLINKEIERLISSGKLKPSYADKRYMFANRMSELINELGNGKMKSILEVILNKKVDLFQTINFKSGSQQRTHSDSIHMSTFPKGNLIATWVALQDVNKDNGPLHYYPGSHKLDYIFNEDYGNEGTTFKLGAKTYTDYEDKIQSVLQKHNLQKHDFLAKKGDMLIWHANLLHGGNKVNEEGSSRKSMVFHFYAEDAICYHEITQRPTLKGKFNS